MTALLLLLGVLATVSLGLTLWQWIEARRYPLHQRIEHAGFHPPLTVLKPLKGCDQQTAACLRSWLEQDYPGPVQVLFGVASPDDPVVPTVRRLEAESARADVRLVVCPERRGTNAKVSTLVQLEPHARHDLWVVSDADVHVPPDFLRNVVAPLRDEGVGLVNPLYALDAGHTLAMRWEEICVNADFWSGVLQSRRLEPLRFALGAVMAVRRPHLQRLGGFAALAEVLADDFELGRRIAAQGARVDLCPVVATCREEPQTWSAVWQHQIRWARTIRVCRPGLYAASILSNATLWPLLWGVAAGRPLAWAAVVVCLAVRVATAADNQRRLTRSTSHAGWLWLVPVKDLLQCLLWALAFLGNTVAWRGEQFRVLRSGELVPATVEAGTPPRTRTGT